MAVITISRQYFSGGKKFARKLAKELGYQYVDKEIYSKVSEISNLSPDEIKAIESISGLGLDFIDSLIDHRYVQSIVGKKDLSFQHEEVKKAIEKAIIALAKSDNIVIVGRGGQCILSDFPNAYHLRIIKNFEDRKKDLMEMGVTESGAEETIKRKDEERKNYIEKFYKENWENPELYHLIINFSKTLEEKAIEVVKGLIGVS